MAEALRLVADLGDLPRRQLLRIGPQKRRTKAHDDDLSKQTNKRIGSMQHADDTATPPSEAKARNSESPVMI